MLPSPSTPPPSPNPSPASCWGFVHKKIGLQAPRQRCHRAIGQPRRRALGPGEALGAVQGQRCMHPMAPSCPAQASTHPHSRPHGPLQGNHLPEVFTGICTFGVEEEGAAWVTRSWTQHPGITSSLADVAPARPSGQHPQGTAVSPGVWSLSHLPTLLLAQDSPVAPADVAQRQGHVRPCYTPTDCAAR